MKQKTFRIRRKQPFSHPYSTFILLASAAKPRAADNRPRNPTNVHNTRDLLSILSLFPSLSPCEKSLTLSPNLCLFVCTVESFLWYHYHGERWKRKARQKNKRKIPFPCEECLAVNFWGLSKKFPNSLSYKYFFFPVYDSNIWISSDL